MSKRNSFAWIRKFGANMSVTIHVMRLTFRWLISFETYLDENLILSSLLRMFMKAYKDDEVSTSQKS
jgi:hypothetical protein